VSTPTLWRSPVCSTSVSGPRPAPARASSCAENCRTPGATLDAFEIRDGYHYQAFTTNTGRGQIPFLEARHRAHARVEDRIRTGKDTGLGHLPSRHQNINDVWTELALLAFTQSMLLISEPELHRAEPKTLRYRLLHVAARITRGQRKVFLRLADTGPGRWPSPKHSPA